MDATATTGSAIAAAATAPVPVVSAAVVHVQCPPPTATTVTPTISTDYSDNGYSSSSYHHSMKAGNSYNATTPTTSTIPTLATASNGDNNNNNIKRRRLIRKPNHNKSSYYHNNHYYNTTSNSHSGSSTTSGSSAGVSATAVVSQTAAEHMENKCLVQAIQNSKVDQIRTTFQNTATKIPMGPIFYPTHAEFDMTTSNGTNSNNRGNKNPMMEYITNHVRPIAEQYGICKIVPPSGWNPKPFFSIPITESTTTHEDDGNNSNTTTPSTPGEQPPKEEEMSLSNQQQPITVTTPPAPSQQDASEATIMSTIPATTTAAVANDLNNDKTPSKLKSFETKYQLLHRLQEGLDFQDGNTYTSIEYIQMAHEQTRQYKAFKYPQHDLLIKHYNCNTSNVSNTTTTTNDNGNSSTGSTGSTDNDIKNVYNNSNKANSTTNDNIAKHLFTIPNLEQDYWDIVENVIPTEPTSSTSTTEHHRPVHFPNNGKFVVEYGNDVDTHLYGSGFPLSQDAQKSIYTAPAVVKPSPNDCSRSDDSDGKNNTDTADTTDDDKDDATRLKKLFQTEDYYRETGWNLNNIPRASKHSVLKHINVAMNGINVPWMYYGSLFTTFCWHNEDNYLYSINYHHMGSPKQWYGVPGLPKDAPEGLEKVFKSYLSMKMREVPDLLHHITTMFSPRLLQNVNVPVYKMVQYEGEFIITFPKAYHCGFSYGPNIGEAVNFATYDWIPFGADADETYRTYQRPAIFSYDRLLMTMAHHCHEDITSYDTCLLLLNELQRLITDELQLRDQLLQSKVRDVSNLIQLRKNVCTHIDDEHVNYDDQRTCHHCKHICFFTAVACQCSTSKVSCLRHSHFMCTCLNTSKYLMIWSTKEELQSTVDQVRDRCEYLQQQEMNNENRNKTNNQSNDTTTTETTSSDGTIHNNNNSDVNDSNQKTKKTMTKNKKNPAFHLLPDIAPGVQEDYERHKNDPILTAPNTWISSTR